MRILFLTSRLPYPPHRGDKLKIWNLIRQVSAVHEVALLSFIQRRSEAALAENLRPYCSRIDLVYLPGWRSVASCLDALPDSEPFQVAYFRSPDMERALRRVLDEWKPNVVHTHLIRLAYYTANLNGIPRVLDMTDAITLYLRKFMEAEKNPLKRFLLGMEYRRMMGYEEVIRRFDRSLVCSPTDRNALLEHVPEASIDLLYNGVDTETFSRRPDDKVEPGRIIFTGNMSYFPNADAARYLVEEIFPLVKSRVPHARLYIVGQNPSPAVRALARPDVVVTGFVEDIRSEYAKSAVAVSPVRFGAGTLNKILEPLAMGVPVVSTSLGVDGLGLRGLSEILVADEPAAFASHIATLLTDEALHDRLATAATGRIRSQFNWREVAHALLNTYAEVSAGARVRAV